MARKATGHTLVELVLVLAIIGICAGVALPALRALLQPAALHGWVSTYAQALHSARQLAVARGRTVTLCPLDPDGRCNGRWGGELALFWDDNQDGRLADPADHIVDVRISDGTDMQVAWRGFGQKNYLSVRANGNFRQNGRFRFCDRQAPAHGRALVLNVTGRSRVETLDCRA